VKKIARLEEQVFYFDEQITLENWSTKFKIPSNKEAFFSDGIHPSKLTYQIWAKDLATKSIETKIF
jgi:lysophospholipase L1-like esterase